MNSITLFTELILTCALVACPVEQDEKPPPIEYDEDSASFLEGDSMVYVPHIDEVAAKKQRRIIELEGELSEASKDNAKLSDELDGLKRELKELQNAYDAINRRDTSDSSDDNAGRNDANVGETVAKGDKYEATFYTAFCPTGCTGVTATGVDVSKSIYHKGKRVIAVDPSVIPLGSHVRVTLADGETFEATALDVGGDIKGNRIDILVSTREEAYRLGKQTVTVEVY